MNNVRRIIVLPVIVIALFTACPLAYADEEHGISTSFSQAGTLVLRGTVEFSSEKNEREFEDSKNTTDIDIRSIQGTIGIGGFAVDDVFLGGGVYFSHDNESIEEYGAFDDSLGLGLFIAPKYFIPVSKNGVFFNVGPEVGFLSHKVTTSSSRYDTHIDTLYYGLVAGLDFILGNEKGGLIGINAFVGKRSSSFTSENNFEHTGIYGILSVGFGGFFSTR